MECRTITSDVQDVLVTERLMATLSGFVGAPAMLIATIGLYGVMSYMVTQRKVEIGVRALDPVSFALAATGLALVSLVAAWIPARRASRLAPTIALRER